LIRQFKSIGTEVVVCVDAEQGMGNSLACGIRASLEAKGWVIALADMPWIKPGTIKQITNELNSGAAIIAPIWQGQRGHPVGFSAIFGSELAQLQGDTGAKSLIQANIHHLKLIDCNDPGILQDIDYPADLIK
jgi:molybdenum cofactor cytidylyltransferase